MTLNYVAIPGVPQQKIDPTFIASVFTGVLASFGIQTASKKGDGTMKMNGNGNGTPAGPPPPTAKEIEQINTLIKAAGKRLSDATNKKAELLAEQDKLRNQRDIIEQRVIAIESSLRNKLNIFPDPLLSKVKNEVERIRDKGNESSLQDRLRDTVAILSAASDFGNTMTVSNEIRDVDDQKTVEVQVLYLGFSGAWYVSKNGKNSGFGKAYEDGWRWTEDKEVAQPLIEALEMYQKEKAPDYVPFKFRGND